MPCSAPTTGSAPASGTPILALGEALVEFMPAVVGTPMRTAGDWRRYAGGGPVTFAATTVRLGRSAGLLGLVGDDPFSRFLVDAVAAEHVDVRHLESVAGRQIGLCFHECLDGVTNLVFQRGDSAATTLSADHVAAWPVDRSAALHVTGTAMQTGPSALEACQSAIGRAHAGGVPVSFDPNIRTFAGATETGRAFDEALAIASVTTPTLDEATAITGKSDPLEAARELRARGPAFVAVTLGPQGCVVLGDDGAPPVHCPGFAVDVVEPTGAGDCHAAAALVGWLAGWPAERIGAFANAAGALAVTQMGHLGPALPTLEAIDRLLEQAGHSPVWGEPG
jgi:2-dehydro-3-deoxygluconokinase